MWCEGVSCLLVCTPHIYRSVVYPVLVTPITPKHRRMRRGGGAGGAAAPPKFGQTVGEIRAKQEEKIGQRKLQINPFGMWMMTSHRQCPRGGCACECLRVGVFFKFWESGWRHTGNVQGGVCLWMSKSRGVFSNFGRVDDVTRAMSKGGGVLVVICVKFRANQPLCPP